MNPFNVHIGKIIQNARVFNLQNWRELPMNSENLPQTVTQLFALLRQRRIDYVLVGGVALLQYIKGRNTEDVDLIMAWSSLQKLPEFIIAKRDEYFAQGHFQELRLDILLTHNPLFEKVQAHYITTQSFAEQEITCATVEGLLLLKLYALPSLYRQGDFARVGLYENDIATLLHYHQSKLEPLWAELSPHLLATDLQSVREIVAEIQQRLARFQNFKQAE